MRYIIVDKSGRVMNIRPKFPSSLNRLSALRRARIAKRTVICGDCCAMR